MEYATAKRDVDALRGELGRPLLPGLQATLEEKSSKHVHLMNLGMRPANSVEPSQVARRSAGHPERREVLSYEPIVADRVKLVGKAIVEGGRVGAKYPV